MRKALIFLSILFFAYQQGFANKVKEPSSRPLESCFELTKKGISNTEIFTDRSFSALQPNVTKEQIGRIEDPLIKSIATKLFNYSYTNAEYRIQHFEAYQPLDELRIEIGNQQIYSRFVNPTGIRIEAHKEITIYAEGIGKNNISVLVANHGRNLGTHPGNGKRYRIEEKFYHSLEDGKNTFTSSIPGNLYISYFTSEYLTAKQPTIHVVSGEVCGYFDVTTHDNKQWKELLEMPYEMLDIKGEHIGMAYSREILKENCPNNGVELVKKHDAIVKAQWELMGLYKYNKVPKNPMFAAWDPYGRSPYASAQGIYTPLNGQKRWCSVWQEPITQAWGLYHELGHHNEMRGLRWQGTQEVTNNLYSCWCEYLFEDAKTFRYEFEQKEDAGDGLGKVINGPYHLYLNQVVHKEGIDWNSYVDFTKGGNASRIQTRSKVCFMWQLQLFFGVVLEMDAYPDYFEIVRNATLPADTKTKQLNYYKYFCDAVKMDLTDIFENGKMLVPYSALMGKEQVDITAADVNDAKSYVAAKGYPKPETSTIYYLTTRTLDNYKNKIPLPNAEMGAGVTVDGAKAIIDNAVWTGAVGIEVYQGDKITNCSVAYTGYKTDNFTLVAFPEEATSIQAVAWDGTRKVIYQK